MPRDGLQFAAELLRSLTPAIILVLELVWLVRWALAKLLVRLQDRAYSAVSTGYLEPSAAPSTANEVRLEGNVELCVLGVVACHATPTFDHSAHAASEPQRGDHPRRRQALAAEDGAVSLSTLDRADSAACCSSTA